MTEQKKLPTNTAESYIKSIDREKFPSGREIVRSLLRQALTMHPVRGNEMLKSRVGVDLDPDFIVGYDDGNGPKYAD